MTEQTDIQLKNIRQKLHQLVKLYQSLQKENLQLKKELEKTHLQEEKSLAEIQSLQQKLDVLSLGVNRWNGSDKEDLQKRIDLYLKEIDKCLSLLNAE
jgi:chromosome segregation ATPase